MSTAQLTRGFQTPSLVGVALAALLALISWMPAQAARAEGLPLQTLNAGLNDAWVSPGAPFQGMFITVYPELSLVFVAWFTFDTMLPPEDATAAFGGAGQRWVTAAGPLNGNAATLNAELTSGGGFNAGDPVPTQDTGYGTITLEFTSCEQALVTYDFPSIGLSGSFVVNRVVPDNVALCETLAAAACTRSEPDLSHGPDDPPIQADGSILPPGFLFDAGPGPDGIPPIGNPVFSSNLDAANVAPGDLVVGIKYGDTIRAYPHKILDWHEVVNDQFTPAGMTKRATLSYCPLTGSAVLWEGLAEAADKTFGTSGLLFNSNLVMYDRETFSFWSQMFEQSVFGTHIKRIPDRLQVVETTWQTWRSMFPDTLVLTENTGFSRDYDDYPYGSYREDNSLLYPVQNSDDDRLHRKARVLGINVGTSSRVYPIGQFDSGVEIINDQVGDMPVVVAGSSNLNFGVVYNRELEDCTVLEFQAVENALPVVMSDNEGNQWDIFGVAVSGPRAGTQLQKTNSYIAFWFAWTAFFPGTEIHQ